GAGGWGGLFSFVGGGLVLGRRERRDPPGGGRAKRSRCRVIAIDYRRAPEHPSPAPTDDGVAAFRHIRDNAAAFGAEASRLAVGGDSAGGAISAGGWPGGRGGGGGGAGVQMVIYPGHTSSAPTDPRP